MCQFSRFPGETLAMEALISLSHDFKSFVETPDILDIYTKILKITCNWQKFYISTFKCLMIFRFAALYPYPPRRHRIFQLLPSKIGTVNKIERLQKRWQTIQCQFRQRTRNIMWNSTIRGVTNSIPWEIPEKWRFCVMCGVWKQFQYWTWKRKWYQ